MKNNNILILLIATLGVGIMCAIVASIAFTYYNGGFDELVSDDTKQTLEAAAANNELNPGVDEATVLEAIQDASDVLEPDYLYQVQLIQKFQTCNASLTVFETSMSMLQIDPSMLDNEGIMAEIEVSLDDVETNCGSLSGDDIPDAYAAMNKEMVKAEKAINGFIEDYRDYFKFKKSKYLENGNDAYNEAMDHMEKAAEMLQEIMSETTP